MSTNKLPKLALCMIVKDESHIIKETLESISKYIDYYVINDTGSTDNTKEIIKDFFDSKGIHGEIVTHEFRSCECHTGEYKQYSFFHFGWNRSYAIKCCERKSEYIWIIDADDLVMGDLELSNLTKDCYLLKYGKDFTYQRPQIIKNDPTIGWHYKDPLHEYLDSNKKNTSKELIKGNYYIDSRRAGARNKDPQKYLKDALIFEELLLKNPNNDRYAFYCGQSYYDYKDFNNAIKWYKKRIDLGGWLEEVFYSYYKIASAMHKLQLPWKDVEKAYMDAYNYCNMRAEPLYAIANYYRLNNDFRNGYKFAKKASMIPYPDKCNLFVYKEIYDYSILDELAINAYYLGKYHESYSINKKLLESNFLPPKEIDRVRQNIKFSESKLNSLSKKICCIYLGNEILIKDTKLFQLIVHIKKYYRVILIGDKIDIYDIDNVAILNLSSMKSLGESLRVDYLLLFNSLNFYYDNIEIVSPNICLIQTDSMIKLHANNGMYIGLYNNDYLNTIFNKLNITKIICVDKIIKNDLARDYRLKLEVVSDASIENDIYVIFDDNHHDYRFKLTICNDSNGLVYCEPNYIKFIKDNKTIYEFSKKILVAFYEDVTKQYCLMPEHLCMLASVNIESGDYSAAFNNCESALKLIKNIKMYQSYKDVVLILKAKILHLTGKYLDSYTMADEVLRRDLLPEPIRIASEEIRDKNIDFIRDMYLLYNKNKIINITKKMKTHKNKKVMVSVTTCKRFDLFEKTINSFLNCCLDIDSIDHWLCVDDNSSVEDRNKMKKTFPFFVYVWKNESQKGHYVSMNFIRNYALNSGYDYVLHMEDDFHFVQKRNYIDDSIKILNDDKKIGQVLFNLNYTEIEPYKKNYRGGLLHRTKDGIRYYIHEYYETDTVNYKNFMVNYKGYYTCAYWPHFSFRPSVMRTSMLGKVGSFYNTAHFEMQYAIEYVTRGYKSAFFDSFCCIHIGKKTWEKNGSNSYDLNKTNQFTYNDDLLNINVHSEKNNIDIWKSFKESALGKLPYFLRYIPTQITELNEFEKKIFYGNNFNYLRSVMSKIMAHLNLFRNNRSKYLMILHENIVFNSNFKESFDALIDKLKTYNYDFILLDRQLTNNDKLEIIETEFKINLESYGGYIISKQTIEKILNYVELHKVSNLNYLYGIHEIKTYTLNRQLYSLNKSLHCSDVDEDTFEFEQLDGYKFYSQMDSFGNDLGFYGIRPIKEYKEICEKENCACFNTLGYIKTQVNPEEKFIFFPSSTKSSQGLYVKI